jgi:hypothetical protein
LIRQLEMTGKVRMKDEIVLDIQQITMSQRGPLAHCDLLNVQYDLKVFIYLPMQPPLPYCFIAFAAS